METKLLYSKKSRVFEALSVVIMQVNTGVAVYHFTDGNLWSGVITGGLSVGIMILHIITVDLKQRIINNDREIQDSQQRIIEEFKRHYNIPS